MYQIKRTQIIPLDLATFWDFFMKADTLLVITPKHMGMEMRTQVPESMYEGLMIEYRMRPLFGIPLNWIAEIKTVKEQALFIDEQRKGPFKIWHHEHHFRAVEGGVEMTDLLTYALPLGFLGRMSHGLLVKPRLEALFDHRYQVLEQIFGKTPQML